jgi:hypothetical protein
MGSHPCLFFYILGFASLLLFALYFLLMGSHPCLFKIYILGFSCLVLFALYFLWMGSRPCLLKNNIIYWVFLCKYVCSNSTMQYMDPFFGKFFFWFSFYRLGQFNLKTRTKLILNVRNFGYYETNGPTQTSKILELTT